MKLQVMSDLHLEFSNGEMLLEPKADVLVLAGDIGIGERPNTYVPFLEEASRNFKHIVMICGNHEYYYGTFPGTINTIDENIGHLKNVHLLEKQSVEIDGVKFVGATLWASFLNGDNYHMQIAASRMNDYRLIKDISPTITWAEHTLTRKTLEEELLEEGCIVVTHHAPSFRAQNSRSREDVAAAYKSDLEDLIKEHKPALWIHGHLHLTDEYRIGNTWVINNPRGYYQQEENITFDPNLVIEI